ncbi:AAA family ATPase [Metallosphaera javensis (ex Sakai et al. 2022)]|uniref:AAA family ATPase n=1 Tax=Metallosphaera javensis (ex Sakai et al. 2022) TaxID=2775498 RepID=UPI0025886557|nr:MAG: ATPase [Metallosphaera javensis (ex Sakai et al. 2022)]
MGKTTLILSLLNSLRKRYIFLDSRSFESREYIAYKDFLSVVEREINGKIKRFQGLEKFLSRVRGVTVTGFSISLSWDGENRVNFTDLLERINEWGEERGEQVFVIIDEAQELIKLRGYSLLPSLAYSYDHLSNLHLVVTGSQVRAFSGFLKLENEESPLYGRAYVKVELGSFDRDTSVQFLRKGFQEHGIEFSGGEEVYEELGGNPGWLTFYGYIAVKRGFDGALEETKKVARRLLRREFLNFLKEGNRLGSRERYERVLRTCKQGCTWSDVKGSLEALEGRKINDATVLTIINNLMDYSFLVKTERGYELADWDKRKGSDPYSCGCCGSGRLLSEVP